MKCFLFLFTFFIFHHSYAQRPGHSLFDSDLIHRLEISMHSDNFWDSLQYYKALRDSTDSTVYMSCDIKFNDFELDSVGIRLKGVGSYDHPGKKKPIKLDFDKYIKGQKLDGLKKLNFTNGTLDPTMIREKLLLDICHRQGIPAPRITFAEIYINGYYHGLYKMIEQVDKKFLDWHFGNKSGNLFKGEPSGNMKFMGMEDSLYYNMFQLKTNVDSNDWSDLVHLIDVVNHGASSDYQSDLNSVFNTSLYLKAWAVYNLFVSLDSYLYLSHNFYIYHNTSTDVFDWIMWDLSLGFGSFVLIGEDKTTEFDLMHLPWAPDKYTRPLNRKMFEVEEFQEEYLANICRFMYNELNTSVLFPIIDSLADRIRPSLAKEHEEEKAYTMKQFEQNLEYTLVKDKLHSRIPGLKAFVMDRRSNVEKQLCSLGYSCQKQEYIQFTDNVIRSFPNPSVENMTIDLNITDPLESEVILEIWNTWGQLVKTITAESSHPNTQIEINTQDLPAGVYWISKQGECNNTTWKFVISSVHKY